MVKAVATLQRGATFEAGKIELIPIGRVLANPLNPRGKVHEDDCLELAASIRANGILQPLLVVPYRSAYYAVAGHRRRVGAKLAGLTVLPCIVQPMNEDRQLDFMLVENIQRKALSPYQEARAFQRMVQRGAKLIDIVECIGVSQSYISQRLAICSLEAAVQQLFEKGLLPVSAAPVLKLAKDPDLQRRFAVLAVQRQISVAKLEQMIGEAVGRVEKKSYASGSAQAKKRLLDERERFGRAEAIKALLREGQVPYVPLAAIAEAFHDICEGLCSEEESSESCESCPAPRLIASLLRRSGGEINGRTVN